MQTLETALRLLKALPQVLYWALTIVPCLLLYGAGHLLGDLYQSAKAGWARGRSR